VFNEFIIQRNLTEQFDIGDQIRYLLQANFIEPIGYIRLVRVLPEHSSPTARRTLVALLRSLHPVRYTLVLL
jgi:hypothetical protein